MKEEGKFTAGISGGADTGEKRAGAELSHGMDKEQETIRPKNLKHEISQRHFTYII